MKIPLKGSVAVLTGSASVFGAAIRQSLAVAGAKVVAVDRLHADVAEDPNARVSFVGGDVACAEFRAALWRRFARCDALVNVAGAQQPHAYALHYAMTRDALPTLRENALNAFGVRACVVNVSVERVHYSAEEDDQYFAAQTQFAERVLGLRSMDALDEHVARLAEQLTAERVRVNTVLTTADAKAAEVADLVRRILIDSSSAGRVYRIDAIAAKNTVGPISQVLGLYHVPPDKERVTVTAGQRLLRASDVKTDDKKLK